MNPTVLSFSPASSSTDFVLYAKCMAILFALGSLMVEPQDYSRWFAFAFLANLILCSCCIFSILRERKFMKKQHADALGAFQATIGLNQEHVNIENHNPRHVFESISALAYAKGSFTIMEKGEVGQFSIHDVLSMKCKITKAGTTINFKTTDMAHPNWTFWTAKAKLADQWKKILEQERVKSHA